MFLFILLVVVVVNAFVRFLAFSDSIQIKSKNDTGVDVEGTITAIHFLTQNWFLTCFLSEYYLLDGGDFYLLFNFISIQLYL